MAQLAIPRTPTPTSLNSEAMESQVSDSNKFQSPPLHLASDLTPPPSTQISRHSWLAPVDSITIGEERLASLPRTAGIAHDTRLEEWFGKIPSVEEVRDLPEEQLRSLAPGLMLQLSQARTSAAHTQMQYKLLSIEAVEAVQRAQVENEMMRREVEVLQTGKPNQRNLHSKSSSFALQERQAQYEARMAVERGRELEVENLILQRRLKQAKKLIKQFDGKKAQLVETNHSLKERIKQNRDHLDAMRSYRGRYGLSTGRVYDRPPFGSPSHTVRNTPSNRTKMTPQGSRQVDGQDPFHALLFAGQVLSGETTSVPTTPTPTRAPRFHLGHTRAVHSLSSLPVTSQQSRPLTADAALPTAVNRILPVPPLSATVPHTQDFRRHNYEEKEGVHHNDRDSTISASDQDEAYTDDDVPASQASQIAANMLRRYSGPKANDSIPVRIIPEHELIQPKLMGRFTKANASRDDNRKKRRASTLKPERDVQRLKRANFERTMGDYKGLGIGVWPSSTS